MARVNILGQTAESLTGNGIIITCMAMAITHGVMEDVMKANSIMILRMVEAHSSGLMVASMKVNGRTVNSMGKVCILSQTRTRNGANGTKVKELSGFHRPKEIDIKIFI